MPEQDPSDFEDSDDWMEYCMGDDAMRQEYPDSDQRRAVCYAMWSGKSMELEKGVRYVRPSAGPKLQVGKAEDSEAGWLEGYAAVFGNIDEYYEIVEPGAFRKTVSERVAAGKVKLMTRHFAHGGSTADIVGTVTEAKEDDYGLWVHADFAKTDLAQETRTLVNEGHVTGLSIGYEPISWERDTTEDGKEILRLKELKLYDVTITAVPVNPEAAITNAKTAISAAAKAEADLLKSEPDSLGDLSTRYEAAAKQLRDAADTLDAVCKAAKSGGISKAETVARWRARVRRRELELEQTANNQQEE